MSTTFKKILIPVDFSINTEIAVKKAIELIEPPAAEIHLLHVQKIIPRFKRVVKIILGKSSYSEQRLVNKIKLKQWEHFINEIGPEVKVISKFEKAKIIEERIIERASDVKPSLIIIGKHSRHSWFPFLNSIIPNRVAGLTGCPVLTVKPGSTLNKIKSVVVPIGSTIPRRKVELILALKRKFGISIHLVTVMKNNQKSNDFIAYAVLRTYRFLRDVVQCPLRHQVLHGNNTAKSAFTYAKSINADILLVDPEDETRLSSFPDKYISDELKPDSRLQILAVRS